LDQKFFWRKKKEKEKKEKREKKNVESPDGKTIAHLERRPLHLGTQLAGRPHGRRAGRRTGCDICAQGMAPSQQPNFMKLLHHSYDLP
jgi:hypothetical protein